MENPFLFRQMCVTHIKALLMVKVSFATDEGNSIIGQWRKLRQLLVQVVNIGPHTSSNIQARVRLKLAANVGFIETKCWPTFGAI